MEPGHIHTISIHDADGRGFLAFDVRDVLSALGDRVYRWQRCLLNELEALSTEAPVGALGDAVFAARPGGVWLSAAELFDTFRTVYQTVDGEPQAFPLDVSRETISPNHLHAGCAESRAELIIKAIDSSFFLVHAKHDEDIARLRGRFRDVRRRGRGQIAIRTCALARP